MGRRKGKRGGKGEGTEKYKAQEQYTVFISFHSLQVAFEVNALHFKSL